jgi:hypothetical protein
VARAAVPGSVRVSARTAIGWNGVQLAEVARLAPRGRPGR